MALSQDEKMKRFAKIRDMVMPIVDLMDNPEKFNHKRYSAMFDIFEAQGRSGEWKDFDKFCNWCNDPDDFQQLDHTLYIQADPFHEPSLSNVLKGLDLLGVPAQESVYFQDFDSKTPVRSRYPFPVGYINVKRMQQILSKKNRYSLGTAHRDLKTNQVTGDSRTSGFSDAEAAAMVTQGYDAILKELWGARGGNEKAANAISKQISADGYATLQGIDTQVTPSDKTTLETINTYLLASGYRSDLISPSLTLAYTLDKAVGKKGGH